MNLHETGATPLPRNPDGSSRPWFASPECEIHIMAFSKGSEPGFDARAAAFAEFDRMRRTTPDLLKMLGAKAEKGTALAALLAGAGRNPQRAASVRSERARTAREERLHRLLAFAKDVHRHLTASSRIGAPPRASDLYDAMAGASDATPGDPLRELHDAAGNPPLPGAGRIRRLLPKRLLRGEGLEFTTQTT